MNGAMNRLARGAEYAWYLVRKVTRIAWLIVRHRPFLTCPTCKGKGGAVSGYYEPEWSECSSCWHHYKDLEDYGLEWFVGRIPPWGWVRVTLSGWCGMGWQPCRVRDLIRCKLGIHRWMRDECGTLSRDGQTCCVCYRTRGRCGEDEDQAPVA